MCFTEKRKRNWIRKEDCVPDPVRPPGRVGYGGASCHSKHEVIEKFVLYKTEVKNKLNKKIKAVRSDRGGEYESPFF